MEKMVKTLWNRKHRGGDTTVRKNILAKKYNLLLTMTETEMATTAGLYKVWDCGLLKYVYKK